MTKMISDNDPGRRRAAPFIPQTTRPTGLIDSVGYGLRAAADSRLPDRQCVSGAGSQQLLSIGTVMTSIFMVFSGYEDSYNVIQLFMAIIHFVVIMLLYEHS